MKVIIIFFLIFGNWADWNRMYVFLSLKEAIVNDLNFKRRDRVVSFPGAEGFGKFTTGGREGRVVFVTNLNDSGPGSFRSALNINESRVVVFKVGGRIKLKSPLYLKYGDVTIAGQTAPGDGICVTDYKFNISADNVVVRFLRFRLGDEKKQADDAFGGINQRNIIIDHCSISWGVDENASFYDNEKFTMQWCIISESLYNSVHPKGVHGAGGIWGGRGASFHHNLLSDNADRNPLFNGSRYTKDRERDLTDFRNNVIYNWGVQSTNGGWGGRTNIINNFFKPGPATSMSSKNRILNLSTFFYEPTVRLDTVPAGRFYIKGNILYNNKKVIQDNRAGINVSGSVRFVGNISNTCLLEHPFRVGFVNTQSAELAFSTVLKKVGATFPCRDGVDARVISEVRSGIEKYGGRFGKVTGIIDSQNDVGGFPLYRSGVAPIDTDSDGIPDSWEKTHGLNPKNVMDSRKVNMEGYTMLELYLNSLVESKM